LSILKILFTIHLLAGLLSITSANELSTREIIFKIEIPNLEDRYAYVVGVTHADKNPPKLPSRKLKEILIKSNTVNFEYIENSQDSVSELQGFYLILMALGRSDWQARFKNKFQREFDKNLSPDILRILSSESYFWDRCRLVIGRKFSETFARNGQGNSLNGNSYASIRIIFQSFRIRLANAHRWRDIILIT
jgi:hypothetical protein